MGFDTRFLNPHKVENSTIRPKANMGLRCGWSLVGIFQATWASTSEHGEFGIACLCIHPHTEPDNDTWLHSFHCELMLQFDNGKHETTKSWKIKIKIKILIPKHVLESMKQLNHGKSKSKSKSIY